MGKTAEASNYDFTGRYFTGYLKQLRQIITRFIIKVYLMDIDWVYVHHFISALKIIPT